MDQSKTRARSFEQDLLWSVLDQDPIPYILTMARDNWNIDPAAAWDALVRQAALGRLRAYRGAEGSFTAIDLADISIDEAAADFTLFVEPTEATRARVAQIATDSDVVRRTETRS